MIRKYKVLKMDITLFVNDIIKYMELNNELVLKLPAGIRLINEEHINNISDKRDKIIFFIKENFIKK